MPYSGSHDQIWLRTLPIKSPQHDSHPPDILVALLGAEVLPGRDCLVESLLFPDIDSRLLWSDGGVAPVGEEAFGEPAVVFHYCEGEFIRAPFDDLGNGACGTGCDCRVWIQAIGGSERRQGGKLAQDSTR